MKLLEKFIENAHKKPDKFALTCDGRHISYGELNKTSSSLARLMLANGFGSQHRAVIYLEKSIDAIVCMLATLKNKGAYVPLDFSLPPKRASFIIKNCEISLLFTTKEKYPQIMAPETLPATFFLETAFAKNGITKAEVVRNRSQKRVQPHQELLSFILYTSGSTGVPKGVKISELNVQVFLDWALSEMNITAEDTLLNLAGFHFDLSVFDIYIALSQGARLVIFPQTTIFNPFAICKTIEKEKVTVLYSVPSVLMMLINSGALAKYDLSSLRYVLFAGEVLPLKYLRDLLKVLPQAHFYNLYGPTETNVCSFFKVHTLPSNRTKPVPIGKAVSGAHLYALNEQKQKIKAGEVGELYVKGPCVTPGYWNHKDPINAENHKLKIHATGDLVTMEDDSFVFCGRKDDQVKICGYRIELREIESTLNHHPDIDECAVLLDDAHLVAFIANKEKLTSLALKQYCYEFLPRYMIPGKFRFLSKLPKNANGKIDRVQLKQSLKRQLVSTTEGEKYGNLPSS